MDFKPLDDWYQRFNDVENLTLDLRIADDCAEAVTGAREVFTTLPPTWVEWVSSEQQGALHVGRADQYSPAYRRAREAGAKNSSLPAAPAFMPPTNKPHMHLTALREEDAYPAMPEDGYGWEKLL